VELPRPIINRLAAQAEDPATACMDIDLASQTISTASSEVIPFQIAAEKKEQLLLGLDEIAATERLLDRITTFEAGVDYACPAIRLNLEGRIQPVVATP